METPQNFNFFCKIFLFKGKNKGRIKAKRAEQPPFYVFFVLISLINLTNLDRLNRRQGNGINNVVHQTATREVIDRLIKTL